MAKNWAFKLQRMSGEQQRLAEKFINDIPFEGESGNLNRNSVMINAVPASPSWSFNSSPIPPTPSPKPYITSTITRTEPLIIHSPSPIPHTQSAIPHTPSPRTSTTSTITRTQPLIIHSPSSIPHTESAIPHTPQLILHSPSSSVQLPIQSYPLYIPTPMPNVPDEIVETTNETTKDITSSVLIGA